MQALQSENPSPYGKGVISNPQNNLPLIFSTIRQTPCQTV